MSTEITTTEGSFDNALTFEHTQRVAKMLSTSTLAPKEYQGNMSNTIIALEMANRIGASPLMVMQNLHIIHGKPGWSSSFIIAALNSSKKFSPLRFEMSGEGNDYGCTAWAYEIGTKEKLEGPKVTWKMVKDEQWDAKAGSKWKTIPELMFRYRAASWFGRLYAPEVLMGMLSVEEVEDIAYVDVTSRRKSSVELPLMAEEDMTAAVEEIQSGNATPEGIADLFSLTDEQAETLKNAKTGE